MFGDHFGLNIVHVEGEQRFLDALAGESDPEAKRKIIGRVFVEVFDEEALKLDDVKWLAQGTIYPDVIESAASATGKAHVIKSHHNVGGLPKEMKMGLVEPLRELFKDEVRKIGLELGLRTTCSTVTRSRAPALACACWRSEERVLRPAASCGRYLHRRAAQS
ncbi:GMP synthase [Klebsiella pneumoniae]|uniref:GMP synthase n=1 Tax=Klebsiella pneumoniae TaxID=573 RepID=A0A3S4KEQ1_KLEPN|nr:GMP synthase [Klebsiella pneumoniae]